MMKSGLQIEIRKAGENEHYFLFKLPNGGIFISKFFENILEAISAAEKTKRSAMEESCYQDKKETGSRTLPAQLPGASRLLDDILVLCMRCCLPDKNLL